MKTTFARVVLGVDIGSSPPMWGFVKALQCSLFNSIRPLGASEILESFYQRKFAYIYIKKIHIGYIFNN
jgi:hypothetical protein